MHSIGIDLFNEFNAMLCMGVHYTSLLLSYSNNELKLNLMIPAMRFKWFFVCYEGEKSYEYSGSQKSLTFSDSNCAWTSVFSFIE